MNNIPEINIARGERQGTAGKAGSGVSKAGKLMFFGERPIASVCVKTGKGYCRIEEYWQSENLFWVEKLNAPEA